MELKDVILSTLAEMEDGAVGEDIQEQPKITEVQPATQQLSNITSADNEVMFLSAIRERLLVLFEGFQAPNNSNLEAKIDMTLNFLEYTLATIDERLEAIKKDNI
ncbi:MAG: hypothetical protein FAF05_00425 [Epsilonproteobacteria bacterium]|nr:hypothetical protein [Campylobacterota bacterium]